MGRRSILVVALLGLAACGGARPAAPPPGPPVPGDPCERLVACNDAIVATLCTRVEHSAGCRTMFSLQISGFTPALCQQALADLQQSLAPYRERVRGWREPAVCR
jgi:hypothetical protein